MLFWTGSLPNSFRDELPPFANPQPDLGRGMRMQPSAMVASAIIMARP